MAVSEETWVEIVKAYAAGASGPELARQYGVPRTTILRRASAARAQREAQERKTAREQATRARQAAREFFEAGAMLKPDPQDAKLAVDFLRRAPSDKAELVANHKLDLRDIAVLEAKAMHMLVRFRLPYSLDAASAREIAAGLGAVSEFAKTLRTLMQVRERRILTERLTWGLDTAADSPVGTAPRAVVVVPARPDVAGWLDLVRRTGEAPTIDVEVVKERAA